MQPLAHKMPARPVSQFQLTLRSFSPAAAAAAACLCWAFATVPAARAQTSPPAGTTAGSAPTSNDDAAPSPIATDRPSFTDSSIVVPGGSLQFENGFTETSARSQQILDFPATLVRFGLTSQTELRLGVPDYFQNFHSGAPSGWGDLSIGLKQQLVATSGGFDASLVAALSFPTGSNSFSSHGYDPQLLVPWSNPVSKNWTAAGMLGVLWPTENGRHNTTGQFTFLVDRQLTNPWDAFVEYGGQYPQRGGPQHLIHFGTSFKVTPRQQLDFHAGFGLSAAAVDHFVGVGYSVRF
jgi:Putative MetA-pathway of phenol degradation